MTDMERKTLCAALSRYGAQAQITMVFEEMAELQDVLCKFLRGRVDGDTLANIAEEIAVAQDQQRWIPVTERLPEVSNSWGVSDVVLCIISDPSGYPPPNPGLCVYLEDGRWTCHGQIVRVTHWMPLPDGPEVE